MTNTSVEIEANGRSHVGKVRADNQDALRAYQAESGGYLYAVADGMGGYEHGGIASTTALDAFIGAVAGRAAGSDIGQALRKGVQDANLKVYQESVRLKARMGTTLTGLYLDGAALHIAHVGDSRAYLIRGGQATCLTNDHTGVGEMVRARVLSPDKVRTHAQRSVLNRCLGMELFVQPDLSRTILQSGDVLVVCSDGLWAVIEDAQIAEIASSGAEAEAITNRLIETALDNDSDDNITAWTIKAHSLPAAEPQKRRGWVLPALLRGRLTAL